MSKSFASGMAKATELTRTGNVQEATALIQSLLGNRVKADPQFMADSAIDGTFTTLDPPSPGPSTPAKPLRSPKFTHAPRGGLGETLRKIAAGGMPGPAPQPNGSIAVAEGAQFLTLTHASAGGSRDYRLYVPANQTGAPLPLIVMLHGCTQTPDDFAIGTGMNALAEEVGCLVAYPAQPSGANMQKCWNWFRPEDQARGGGEPALIAGLTRDILQAHSGDKARVYVAGLSAGGAAAAIVAAAYPDIFSAVGVHSGLPTGAASDVPSAFAAMRSGAKGKVQREAVPTIVFHGQADTTVHPDNGLAVKDQAAASGQKLKTTTVAGTSAGGRAYRQTTLATPGGRVLVEHWEIAGAGHAWAGGHPKGSYTDPKGPDASREMLRFFLQHAKE